MTVTHKEVTQVEAPAWQLKPQELLNDEQYNIKTVFNAATAHKYTQ